MKIIGIRPTKFKGDSGDDVSGKNIYGDRSFQKSDGAALAAPDKMSKCVSI